MKIFATESAGGSVRKRQWMRGVGGAAATRKGHHLGDSVQDLTYALRQARRTPGVTSLVVLTLAVGIAANITMGGAIDRLLLRAPAGIRDPDRVVRLLVVGHAGNGEIWAGGQNY